MSRVRHTEEWGMTEEDEEFQNYEVAPVWKGAKKNDKFAMTVKWCGCFDGTGGETFMKRAMRKSDTIFVRRFTTKAALNKHPYMNGRYPHYHYVFIWDREMNLVNGVY